MIERWQNSTPSHEPSPLTVHESHGMTMAAYYHSTPFQQRGSLFSFLSFSFTRFCLIQMQSNKMYILFYLHYVYVYYTFVTQPLFSFFFFFFFVVSIQGCCPTIRFRHTIRSLLSSLSVFPSDHQETEKLHRREEEKKFASLTDTYQNVLRITYPPSKVAHISISLNNLWRQFNSEPGTQEINTGWHKKVGVNSHLVNGKNDPFRKFPVTIHKSAELLRCILGCDFGIPVKTVAHDGQ